jgi:hypothetical protein
MSGGSQAFALMGWQKTLGRRYKMRRALTASIFQIELRLQCFGSANNPEPW